MENIHVCIFHYVVYQIFLWQMNNARTFIICSYSALTNHQLNCLCIMETDFSVLKLPGF